MMALPPGAQIIEIFVTHVSEEGPLLKIWGQLDRTAATFVERLILQYAEQFDRGAGLCHPSNLRVGQVCCAKFRDDGRYYRGRIVDLNNLPQGVVRVHFIDYGNTDITSVGNIRSLQVVASNPLISVGNQATSFYLAGVMPLTGNWNQENMEFIREKICYAEWKSIVVGHVGDKRLISVLCDGRDFSELLAERHIAARVPLNVQQSVIQSTNANRTIPPSIPVNPPSLPMIDSNVNFLQRNAPPPRPQESAGGISAPVLPVGSKHSVFVAHVVDGPTLFTLHLQSMNNEIQYMFDTLNKDLPQISQPPIPGSLCVGRIYNTQGWINLRAVVINVMDDGCELYFIDFGSTGLVPVERIFEVPPQVSNKKSMALRFCLAGLKDMKLDTEVNKVFQDLVVGKNFTLVVTEPEGPPLKQYGHLLNEDGENVLKTLRESQKRVERLTYPALPLPNPGRLVGVTVSYVESVKHFFVQYDSQAAALKSLMDSVAKYCKSSAASLNLDELYPGQPVCALFSTDQQWYRGKVLSNTGSEVSVFYVDYGNTDIVNISSLRRMDRSICRIQAQAVLCCLQGFQDSDVRDEQSERFEELTLEKSLTMKIVSTLPSGQMVVELFDMGPAPPVGIASLLKNPAKSPAPVVPYAQTTIDEWQNPGEPSHQQPSKFKEAKKEDGGGDSWKSQKDGWGEKRDNRDGDKWGNRDDKPRKWNRDEGGEKKWNRDDGGEKKWNRDDGGEKKWNRDDGGEKKWNRDDGGEKKWNRDDGGEKKWNRDDRGEKKWNRDGDDRKWGGQADGEGGDKPWKSRDDRRSNWRSRDQQSSDGKWDNQEDKGFQERRYKNRDDNEDGSRKWGRNEGDGDRRRGDRPERKFEDRENKWSSNRQNDTKKPWNDNQWKQKDDAGAGVNSASVDEDWGEELIPTTSSGKAYPAVNLSIGAKEMVTLATAIDPNNFVVQLDSQIPSLDKLMEQIKTMYESGGVVLSEELQKPSTPCIARYAEDSTWYRASIFGNADGGSIEVHFVDYGNFDRVSTSEIKEIVPEILNVPIFGVHCSLLEVHTPIAEWSEEQISQFFELAEEKKLQAQFVKKSGPLFEVILHDIDDDSLSINEKFGASKDSLEKALSASVSAVKSASSVQVKLAPSVASSLPVDYACATDSFALPNIEPESREKVIITWFIKPDQFFCQLKSSSSAFTTLVNEIQTAYKGRPASSDKLSVGSPVVARFPSDKVLYRAVVKEDGELKLKVQYVDYGNSELLMEKDIWPIEKKFMVLPQQAILCGLSDIVPQGEEWSTDCSEYDKLFGSDNIECVFHGTDSEGKHSVSLYINGDKNIADELVASGVAQKKKSQSKVSDGPLAYDLLQGQRIPAHVSYIESIAKFFVHLNATSANDIQAQVDSYTSNKKNPTFPASDLIDQRMCLASPEEGVWYRGRLEAPTGSDTVSINFVDYGDKAEISVDKIQPIPPSLSEYQDQATECFVIGSDKQEIAKDVNETFQNEVQDQDVILMVDAVINKRLSIHLFDIEGQRLELLKSIDTSLTIDVEPLCPMPVLTNTLNMWVSHVDGANAIYLQKVNEANVLSGLLDLMYEFYEEKQQGLEVVDPQEDQPCAAKSVLDGQWYRGKVLSVSEEGLVVRYIDYGNTESLALQHVKELDLSFCRLHSLALHASLAVVPKDAEGCAEEIRSLIEDKNFDVSFLKDNEGKWIVNVENNEIEIAQHLIDKEMANEMEGFQFLSQQISLSSENQQEVLVSHYENPTEIWVQQNCDADTIMNLQDILAETGALQAPLQNCKVGQMCIALYLDDLWYRAKILEINDATLKVLFVDYGNTYEVEIANVRKLPKKFFTWPYYGVKCSLKADPLIEKPDLEARLKVVLSDPEKIFTLDVTSSDPVIVDLFVDSTTVFEAAEKMPEAVEEPTTTGDQVNISFAASVTEFWLQNTKDSSVLDSITSSLELAEDFDVLKDHDTGNLCAAKFPDDEMWYRAKITSCTEGNIEVYFIDYGNSSAVEELRGLPSELASVQPLARRCSLHVPKGLDKWPEEAETEFLDKFGDGTKELECTIIKEGDPAIVSLTVSESGEKIERELLVKCGIDPISEETQSEAEAISRPADLITISHVYSASAFWIQKNSESSLLDSVTNGLTSVLKFDALNNVEEGIICAALFPEDDVWYRAKIMSCTDGNIEVYFIDYGNSSTVVQLRALPPELASLPPLATRCSLHGPEGLDRWPEEAETEFFDKFGDGTKEFECTIIKEGDPTIVSLKIDDLKVEEEIMKKSSFTKDEQEASDDVEVLSESETFVESSDDVLPRDPGLCVMKPLQVNHTTESLKTNDLPDAAVETVDKEKTEICQSVLFNIIEAAMSQEAPEVSTEDSAASEETPKQFTEDTPESGECLKERPQDCVVSEETPKAFTGNFVEIGESLKECPQDSVGREESSNELTEDSAVSMETPKESIHDSSISEETCELPQDVGESSKLETAEEDPEREKDLNISISPLASPKKDDVIPKTTIVHAENLVKDFNVEMILPVKEGAFKSSGGLLSSNVHRSPHKLGHSEKIVPGSVSSNFWLSQNDSPALSQETSNGIRQRIEQPEGANSDVPDFDNNNLEIKNSTAAIIDDIIGNVTSSVGDDHIDAKPTEMESSELVHADETNKVDIVVPELIETIQKGGGDSAVESILKEKTSDVAARTSDTVGNAGLTVPSGDDHKDNSSDSGKSGSSTQTVYENDVNEMEDTQTEKSQNLTESSTSKESDFHSANAQENSESDIGAEGELDLNNELYESFKNGLESSFRGLKEEEAGAKELETLETSGNTASTPRDSVEQEDESGTVPKQSQGDEMTSKLDHQ